MSRAEHRPARASNHVFDWPFRRPEMLRRAGTCTDLLRRTSEGLPLRRRGFQASVRPAGVLEPRRGHPRDRIFACRASLQCRTSLGGRGEGWCENAMITCTYEQSGR